MTPWLKCDKASELTCEEVSEYLHTDLKNGLSWKDSEARRQLYGFNEFQVTTEEPLWKKYLEQVTFFIRLLFNDCNKKYVSISHEAKDGH